MQRLHDRVALPGQGRDVNVRTTPQQFASTIRTDFKRVLTTGFAGKLLPVMAIPLLREDSLRMSTFRFGFEMAETAQMLMNPVRVKVAMHFVPKLAFERFRDIGQLNRSYLGQPEVDDQVTPWFLQVPYWDNPQTPHEFYQAMGLHAPQGAQVNSDYLEAYNAVWNHEAVQVSPSLTPRDNLDATLAPAFWQHSAMKHVKPTFDQALLHGEVPLNVTGGKMPVQGIGIEQNAGGATAVYDRDGNIVQAQNWTPGIITPTKEEGFDVFAELEDNGITVSLANIELAKRTAAFARARQQYQGLDDDAIIDLLMSGVRIPEESLKHPMLIGQAETVFGMSQRYATDSGNLEKSVTRGQTMIDLRAMVPQQNTAGVVIATAQILPEQLYERQADIYLMASSAEDLPNRLKDELDLEPVEIVTNGQVDTDHTDADGVFGYAPLNHRWQRQTPNIGGLYHRPDASDPWNENRDRIWAVETVDPLLGDDFYLATNIHHRVFQDFETDPFEISATGVAQIEGLTFFGPALRESQDDYDKVFSLADTSRIELPDAAGEDGQEG